MKRLLIGLMVLSLAGPMTASPTVELSMHDGRVWLVANRATVAEILAEWTRLGRTQFITPGRATDRTLTIDLKGVPELEALSIILRSTGGFVTVSRTAGLLDDAAPLSRFSRVVIVAAATDAARSVIIAAVPAATPELPQPSPQASFVTSSGSLRVLGADGLPVPDDQENAPPAPWTPPVLPPGASMPPGFSERPDAPSVKPPRRPGGPTAR